MKKMNKKYSYLQEVKDDGFTLVEVLIASALSGVLFLAGQSFFTNVDKETKKSSANLEKVILSLHTDVILRKDFSKSKFSFNTLFFKDDDNLEFFDYLSDGLCGGSSCKRTVELEIPTTENEYSNSFFILIEDAKAGHDLMYNPVDAYSSAIVNSLNFISLNRNNILKNRSNSPWQAKKLILIYSPTPIRSPSSVEGQDPARNLSFLGWIDNGEGPEHMIPESISISGNQIYKPLDPRTGSLLANEDQFLRKLPYVAGLGTYVMVNAVKVVRYRVKSVKKGSHIVGQLLRAEKQFDGTFKERVIGFDIKKMAFYRDDISFPTIGIDLEVYNQIELGK